MKDLPTVVYLHGLGSSPQSAKARLFADYFAVLGYDSVIPELSVPSLQQLSVRVALERVVDVLTEVSLRSPIILIGSSFGGFLAVHALGCLSASVRDQVRGLVLLAPVLYPWHPRAPIISEKMEAAWREAGVFPIAEGATGQYVPVDYQFLSELQECARYEPHVAIPTLVVHGVRDEAVPYAHSVEFVGQNSAARLIAIHDDHQMLAEPQRLVAIVQEFIQGLGRVG